MWREGCSLDIFVPRPVHPTGWKRGLRNGRRGLVREESYTWSLKDQFPILPALSVPKEGLSEAVVWGRLGWVLCYIWGTTRPVIAGEKKYTESMIPINQVLHYCTSSNCFLSCSVIALEWVSNKGLDCICKFRQGGQIVSWMTTSEAVPPWGGTGRGGRALGPEDRSKSTLLFSSWWEGGKRQERWWGAGASWYSGAGGHYCGTESKSQSVWKWQLHQVN